MIVPTSVNLSGGGHEHGVGRVARNVRHRVASHHLHWTVAVIGRAVAQNTFQVLACVSPTPVTAVLRVLQQTCVQCPLDHRISVGKDYLFMHSSPKGCCGYSFGVPTQCGAIPKAPYVLHAANLHNDNYVGQSPVLRIEPTTMI